MRQAAALLAAVVLLGGCVASRAFRDAEREEAREHFDVAVLAYEKALSIEPNNIRYKIALSRARQRAARAHYERGKLHRGAGQLDMAAVELEQSVALDPTNDVALQDLKRVQADIEARRIETAGGTPIEKAKAKARGARATPPMLVPSSTKPISLSFPQETPIKRIYQFLASAAGINVIYDPQLKDDKFSIELRDVSFQKALETVMRQAGHFYKVIDEKTILVAQDTNQNRKEYEDLVIRTFFLSNGDIKDVSAMVRSLLDLRRLGTIPQLNAIVIRDTADKVAVAERIIDINDKAKAEVVVDVELLQLDTQKALTLGAELGQYSTTGVLTSAVGSSTSGGSTNGSTNTTSGGVLPWRQLFRLGLNDFSFTVPSLTFNFYKDNLDAEVLAKPQLRIEEGEKAQLVIGNRVPIPVTTVNTTQAIGQVGVVPITSFQYQEVGIKIDIEPRVHHNKEVTLKLTVEVSNLNGSVSGPNGQEQPIIGTRTITSTIRLKDGETNILAGLIRRDSSKEKLAVPFLGDIPLIGQLFSKHKDTNNGTDLFLTLTPHIIRAPSISEDDLLPVWVGTENNVSFSGLNTRLESPTAPGSPFDAAPSTPPVRPPVVNPGLRGQQPAPTPFPIAPGTAPRDIFKNPVIVPTPAPTRPPSQAPDLGARPATDDGTKSALAAPLPSDTPAPSAGPTLALASSADALAPGQTGTVTLNGLSGLAEAGALELTLEWDPSVAEVTGIVAGPWQTGPDGASTRFEADRTPGRARLQLARPVGTWGLPSGVLAELSVKGVAPGTTLFRVSAAAGAAKTGGVAPTIQSAALTVGQ